MLRALALVLLAAAPARGGGVLDVVTTSTDLKALVEAVGGERVTVESLAPAVHEPHAVDVKPGQLARLRSAALLARVGLDHEPWLTRVRAAVNDPRFAPGGTGDLDLSRGIDLLQNQRKLSRLDAYGLASMVMDCRLAAPAGEQKAVHCLVPKSTWVAAKK